MKNTYSADVFPSVWQKLGDIARKEIVVSPREVLRELKKRDDELHKWAEQNISFHNFDSKQQEIVNDIMARFQNFVDLNKPTPEADPFVIALAKSKNLITITQENYVNISGPKSKPKIPNVCEALNVKWIRLLDLLREQRWEF